jgi:hypothetical protein
VVVVTTRSVSAHDGVAAAAAIAPMNIAITRNAARPRAPMLNRNIGDFLRIVELLQWFEVAQGEGRLEIDGIRRAHRSARRAVRVLEAQPRIVRDEVGENR